eukprot:gene13786-13907_t
MAGGFRCLRAAQGFSHLHLGRLVKQCVPTELLREPAVPKDPWKDRDPDRINPRQVDGSSGNDLEEIMLLRQQLENSALPNVFKRSHLMTPFWEEVLLDVKRTVKVTKGGKVETLHALVVVGNHDGVIGVGEHSGKNVQKVTLDAHLKAYKNLKVIPRYRGHTIFHPIDIRHREIRMRAWPRQLGFGITANPIITQLCDLAGIDNITIKLSGRRKNIKKVVELFVEALSNQSVPHDGVEGSGVYMREVYPWKKLPCGLRRGVDVP